MRTKILQYDVNDVRRDLGVFHSCPQMGDALAAWARQLPELPATLDRLALWTWSEDRRSRLFRIVAEVPARLP
jgi:hypothetical protein